MNTPSLLCMCCKGLMSVLAQFEGSTEDVSVSQLSHSHGASYMEDVA